jgi:regulatory protein
MDEAVVKVTDRLRGLCSRREYCVEDVRQKALKALEGDKAAAARVVATLVAEKYVDDLRYASAFARDKASIQGWGDVKIRYMLSAKRISREVVDQALAEIDADRASSKLFKLLETKHKSLCDDPQCRLKLLRFALGRGYGYDDASAVISQLMKS